MTIAYQGPRKLTRVAPSVWCEGAIDDGKEVVAVTGSREIPNPVLARRQVTGALQPLTEGRVSHLDRPRHVVVTGGCIGMDAMVARVAFLNDLWVHTVLPANRSQVDPEWMAYCTSYEEMPDGTTFMDRNDRMIELATYLFAFPATAETLRSGTWATVRRGRTKQIPVLVYPIAQIERSQQSRDCVGESWFPG